MTPHFIYLILRGISTGGTTFKTRNNLINRMLRVFVFNRVLISVQITQHASIHLLITLLSQTPYNNDSFKDYCC